MDILSWVLVAVVGFNVVALIYRTGVPLLKYETAKGRAVRQKGKIISSYGEEKIKKGKKSIDTFYPVYQYRNEKNEEIKFNGLVRYAGDKNIGSEVDILYDKETGEAWCERDLPLMKKQIVTRFLLTMAVIAVLIATSKML